MAGQGDATNKGKNSGKNSGTTKPPRPNPQTGKKG